MANICAGQLLRLILGLLLLVMSGCGYKNAPIPPESIVPLAINDLNYQTDEKGVRLSWSYPVTMLNGKKLDDISSFKLYRAEIPLDEYCRNCPVPFGKPITLAGGAPVDGKVRRKADFQDLLLRPGYKYFYKVRSSTSWWADSADSNIVSFAWFTPASAPEGVLATPRDRQVTLSWQPVDSLIDGTKSAASIKYQLQRSIDGKIFEAVGEPTAATEYVDREVTNGVQYFYTIRSMMVLKDELVNGGVSSPVKVTPMDLTPPKTVTGVTVVQTAVGTKIFWERNKEDDLGGYTIYRRTAGEKNFTLLGTVDAAYTLFVDNEADKRIRYFYAVTARDTASPPNESNKSKEAAARY